MKAKRPALLAQRVFHLTLLGCILLGVAALVMGMILYYFSMSGQRQEFTRDMAEQAFSSLRSASTTAAYANEVMTIYRETNTEDRQGETYAAMMERMEERPIYKVLRSHMEQFLNYNDVYAAYIGMLDPVDQNVVFIVDPDAEDPRSVGQFEKVSKKAIRTLLETDPSEKPCLIEYTREYGWMCTAAAPIRNIQGEVCAFVFVDAPYDTVMVGLREFSFGIGVALLLLTAGIATFLAWRMKKTVVEPINSIAAAAESYVEDRRNGVETDGHFAKLNIRTGDEVENLQKVMNSMEQDLTEIESTLTSVTAENERIGTELDLARRIQADMLPNIFPPFPERTDMNIYASMDPAKEVGGDFYDFFLLDRDHLAMVIADVSGKGVPAALFMMISKILVQNYSMMGVSPKDVLERVNQQICQNNREEMFITVWLGILDLKNGHMTCANAGHEYPILMQPNHGFEIIKDRHGLVIGGLDSARYTNYELKLDKGAKLFIYTDGVPEATNEEGQLFGMERLLEALNEATDKKPQQILQTIRHKVDAFVGNAPQFDDLTMLCLEYIGPQHLVKEVTKPARVDSIPAVTAFITEELEAMDCPMKVQMQIELAIDELFSNIAHYAYAGGKGEATVRIEHLTEQRGVMLTFIDTGIAYNPLEAPEPDVTLPAEERQTGGLGIFMVRKTMDEVAYEHVDGRNVLRIKKLF
ncbi:MAG: SpoIIE family protein phosphatase [Clostridiales bacterium]|nr:SpoIIE family protein phosphatase [Clostridiales bacterium]